MKIEKPGFYRTKSGLKAEVTDIRHQYAQGWIPREGDMDYPHTWATSGRVFNGMNTNDIVAEWRDPVTKTAALTLCQTTDGTPYICFGKPDHTTKVLARKTVTIIEGEGVDPASRS